MHVFIESAQKTPAREAVSATPKCCAHHPCHHRFHSALCCTAECPLGFSKVQLLVNAFGVFWAFYHGHFLHNFHAQGVTLKNTALATKCIFQNYSVVGYLHTAGFKKTTEELFVPNVYKYLLSCMLRG